MNIQNEWVFPVAHALAAAGVPFVFLTAYALDSVPAEHRARPFLQKPHVPEVLLAAVVEMVAPPAEDGEHPVAANDERGSSGSQSA